MGKRMVAGSDQDRARSHEKGRESALEARPLRRFFLPLVTGVRDNHDIDKGVLCKDSYMEAIPLT